MNKRLVLLAFGILLLIALAVFQAVQKEAYKNLDIIESAAAGSGLS
ncbi:MAG: hypothetical protein Q7R88_01635 [bacterium]|nr:hypothetical protein [bacterium]